MEGLVKKILLSVLGINGFLFSKYSEAEVSSDSEQAAIQEMNQALQSAATPIVDKVMDELRGANVRADSKEPEKFQSPAKLELVKVEFDTSRLLEAMGKWGRIKVTLSANTRDKAINWVDNCHIKIYLGYNGCRSDGKMLLFKAECTCITLPTNVEQSIIFFTPGDVRKRYNLSRVPDYCALRFAIDGVSQLIVIVNKNGKDTHRSDSNKQHETVKKRSQIDDRTIRNVDQLPVYADIRIDVHPTLRTEIDA
ncbi:MAG: hypothetical protein LBB05_01250 [Puniceicoccales bacterium]|jgi:hypothetical protein|nr:hypothetical protein [Puniceicoccales bacterium]